MHALANTARRETGRSSDGRALELESERRDPFLDGERRRHPSSSWGVPKAAAPWVVSDGLWARIAAVAEGRATVPLPRAASGLDDRAAPQGILFVLHTGIHLAASAFGARLRFTPDLISPLKCVAEGRGVGAAACALAHGSCARPVRSSGRGRSRSSQVQAKKPEAGRRSLRASSALVARPSRHSHTGCRRSRGAVRITGCSWGPRVNATMGLRC